MFRILFASNPSIGFLWAVLVEAYFYMKESELDRTFDSIVRDVEEEMEEEEERISVAIIEDKAYWVVDNTFYEADIIDGEIDKTSSKPVNAFDMSYRDMNKMLFILDNLTEG